MTERDRDLVVVSNVLTFIVFAFAVLASEDPPATGRIDEPERVIAARTAHEAALVEKVEALGLAWPPRELYVRMFKDERAVEVWVGDGRAPLELLETFAECGQSGVIGPKAQRGDLQVPEGFYVVRRLNPWSPGLLSLQLDYPNDADRARRARRHAAMATSRAGASRSPAVPPPPLGGDIAVHGTCISTGCIAIDDAPIEQLYLLALEPQRRGNTIRVHVFPTRMEPARIEAILDATDDIHVVKLWTSMIPAYHAFERTRRPPITWARLDGTYGVRGRSRQAPRLLRQRRRR